MSTAWTVHDPPRRVTLTQPRLATGGSGWPAVVLGLAITIGCGYLGLVGSGQLEPPQGMNAPLVVVGAIGYAFSLAGLTLVYHGLVGVRVRARRQRLRRRHPDRPWLADHAWDPGGISDNPHAVWLRRLLWLIMLSLFLVPLNWWGFASGDGPWMVRFMAGLCDLLLIALGLNLLKHLLAALKFGRSRLAFPSFPLRPGRPQEVLFAPNQFERLTARLRFVDERLEQRQTHKGRRTHQVAYEHACAEQILIPPAESEYVSIVFDIPDNPDWFTQLIPSPGLSYWLLEIEAEQPGIDFATHFVLPVYR